MTDPQPFAVRRANPEEFQAIGQMTVSVYEQLPGMPGVVEQPDYYAMLMDVRTRAATPGIEILVATGREGELLGAVTFVGDMAAYNAGGMAFSCADASGIRLLAVRPEARKKGVGKALTRACIDMARALGRKRVLLHTTRAMTVAWTLYEGMGFVRSPDLDFFQGRLAVFGFSLRLEMIERT